METLGKSQPQGPQGEGTSRVPELCRPFCIIRSMAKSAFEPKGAQKGFRV